MYIIINECKLSGGTEVFVQKLKQILLKNKMDSKCIYIVDCGNEYNKNEISLKYNGNTVSKLLLSPYIIKNMLKVINSKDRIIVNNVFSSSISIYASLLFSNSIQIVHDYSIVCPKSTCIKDNDTVCKGYKFEHCLLNCTYHKSKIQLFVKLILTYVTGWLRKRVIKQFISPSKKLAQYANENGFRCVSIPNPVPLSIAREHTLDSLEHHYIYIGGLNENKGLYDMLPAFSKFAAGKKNIYLDIYGKPATVKDEEFLKLYESENIKHHGSISHDKVNEVLRTGYALLIPSKWMENYPTTVLEGFANRLLVIGSDRGGISELLENNRGICYKYGRNELITALKKAETLSKNDYKTMTDNGVKYILGNNTDEIYFKRLRKYLQ